MAANTTIKFPPAPHTHNIEDLITQVGTKVYDTSTENGVVNFKNIIRTGGIALGRQPNTAYIYNNSDTYDICFRVSREQYKEGSRPSDDKMEYISIITIIDRLTKLENQLKNVTLYTEQVVCTINNYTHQIGFFEDLASHGIKPENLISIKLRKFGLAPGPFNIHHSLTYPNQLWVLVNSTEAGCIINGLYYDLFYIDR